MINNIKNFKINKKLALTIGGFLLVGSLTGCANKNEKVQEEVVVENVKFEEFLNEHKDNTYLDEIINLNENIAENFCTIRPNCSPMCDIEIDDETVYLSTCIKELETYIELVDKIDSLHYDKVDELNKLDEQKMAFELYPKVNDVDYINSLIDKFNSEDLTTIDKARCMQELQYFNDYYKTYIWHNGLTITEDLLKKALKSYVCQVSGLEYSNYTSCKISGDSSARKKTITLVDPVSGIEIEYFIDKNSGIINTVLDDLYAVQNWGKHSYNMYYDDVYKCCVPSFNDVKELIKTGVTLENNTLVPLEETVVKAKTK